jgi:hypothetical protein
MVTRPPENLMESRSENDRLTEDFPQETTDSPSRMEDLFHLRLPFIRKTYFCFFIQTIFLSLLVFAFRYLAKSVIDNSFSIMIIATVSSLLLGSIPLIVILYKPMNFSSLRLFFFLFYNSVAISLFIAVLTIKQIPTEIVMSCFYTISTVPYFCFASFPTKAYHSVIPPLSMLAFISCLITLGFLYFNEEKNHQIFICIVYGLNVLWGFYVIESIQFSLKSDRGLRVDADHWYAVALVYIDLLEKIEPLYLILISPWIRIRIY